jgi:hypothetical protein
MGKGDISRISIPIGIAATSGSHPGFPRKKNAQNI